MKKFLIPFGLFVMALFLIPTASTLASPGFGDFDSCVGCHVDGVVPSAQVAFLAQHDGAVGECATCHTAGSEPIHGEWTDTADSCARCHRTHSAAADGLLALEADALCEFCHGNTPGNAQTNVLAGLLRYNTGSLRGGGFETVVMNHDTNLPDTSSGDPEVDDLWRFPVAAEGGYEGAVAEAVTSTHSLGIEATIWGSGDISELTPVAGADTTILECTSCHDPHAYGETYRMLRRQPVDSALDYRGSVEYAYVTDQLAYAQWNPTSGILRYTTDDYTVVDYLAPDVYDDAGNLVTVTWDYHGPQSKTKHSQQLAQWCSACHKRYHAEKDVISVPGRRAPGSNGTGDAIFNFQHKTGDAMDSATTSLSCGYNGVGCHGVPQREDINEQLSCLGCHVAHGTSATMTEFAQIPWPGEAGDTLWPGTAVDPTLVPWDVDGEWDARSSLLRIDNRGVCQNAYCHPMGRGDTDHVQGMDY